MVLIFWYGMLSLLFLASDSPLVSDGYYTTSNGVNTTIDSSEFNVNATGMNTNINPLTNHISLGSFLMFVGLGIGLPGDTPAWFVLCFSLLTIAVNILGIGFIVSSIWNG
jgi:hypothetical protein